MYLDLKNKLTQQLLSNSIAGKVQRLDPKQVGKLYRRKYPTSKEAWANIMEALSVDKPPKITQIYYQMSQVNNN